MSARLQNGSFSKTRVSEIFSDKPDLLQRLYSSHPDVKPDHVVFDPTVIGLRRTRHSYTSDVTEIVAPAPPHVTCDVIDRRFGVASKSVAQGTSPSSPLSSCANRTQFLYLRDIHVVGVLTSSSRGFLRLHAHLAKDMQSCHPSHCANDQHLLPILIAPAPPPHFRRASVYISDWRLLPADSETPPIMEVLLHHIHLLDDKSRKNATFDGSTINPIILSRYAAVLDRKSSPFAISGVIAAKSQIMAVHSKFPAFLVELISASEYCGFDGELPDVTPPTAVTVVFSGKQIYWWPFLSVLSGICISHVRHCALLTFPHKAVKVVSGALVYPHPIEQQQQQQQQPQPQPQQQPQQQPQSQQQQQQQSQQQQQQQPQPQQQNQRQEQQQWQFKSSSLQLTDPHFGPQRSRIRKRLRSGSIVNYEGIVTRHMRPAAILLDEAIALHLGEFNHCVAGPVPHRAFRLGTRISVSHLIAVIRPATPVRLFSTARTSTNVKYFGDMNDLGPPIPKTDRLWISLCKRMSSYRIMAAEELFDAFVRKFRRWFTMTDLSQSQTQTQTQRLTQNRKPLPRFDEAVVEALLGNVDKAGLVQYVMKLLGDNDDILRSHTLVHRNVSKEFLNPVCRLHSQSRSSSSISTPIFEVPAVPTFANVRDALSLMYRRNVEQRQQEWRTANSALKKAVGMMTGIEMKHGCTARNRQVVFDDEDVSRKITASSRIPGSSGLSTGVALVGLVQGTPDGRGVVFFSDGTDAFNLRCVPSMPPSLVGAMVCVRRFTAVVDLRTTEEESICENDDPNDANKHNQPHLNHANKNSLEPCVVHVTLVCDISDFKVVIDGPCVNMDRDKISELTKQNTRHSSHVPLQQTLAILRQGSQIDHSSQQRNLYSQVLNQDDADDGVGIVDVPLVCIFVQHVKRSPSSCVLAGRLIATVSSRNEEEWTVVDCGDHKGFWGCEFHMQGQSMLTMSACFTEGQLYAVSCTELEGVTDPLEFLSKKAVRTNSQNGKMRLYCDLDSVLPWVENLGLGIYMRFRATTPKENEHEADNSIIGFDNDLSLQNSCLSQEGEQYIYVSQAIEQFRKETVDAVENRVWKLYEWRTDQERFSTKVFCVRGIVKDIETAVEQNNASGSHSLNNDTSNRLCIVDRVTIVDDLFGLFDVVVCFSDGYEMIRGMAKGMKVTIRNLIRAPFPSRRNQAFEFVGNPETSICIHSSTCADATMLRNESTVDEFCMCRNPVHIPFQRMCDELGSITFIDEFMGRGDRAVGLIHIHHVQVEYLRIRLGNNGRTMCDECGIPKQIEDYVEANNLQAPPRRFENVSRETGEEGLLRTVVMDVAVQVGDGSRVGVVRCSGFDMCMHLASASKQERDALLRLVASAQDVQVERADGPHIFVNRFMGEARQDANIVWGLFRGPRSNMAVLSVVNKAAVNERVNGCFQHLSCVPYWFGYRRSVVTARPRSGDRVLLECVAVFEQGRSLSDSPCNEQYQNEDNDEARQRRNVVSYLTLVKNMLLK